jgi:ATP-binding cassette, subfamily B, bacterial
LGIITPFLTQAAFDRALFPLGGGAVRLELLAWLVAGMVAIPVVSALIGVYQTYQTTLLGNRVMADLRGRLFEHLQRLDLSFFTATRTGAIQSRLANDVGGVQSVLSETASSILGNVVTVLAALVAMVVLSWRLTLVAVLLIPLFVLLQVRVGRVRRKLAGRTQESLSEMTALTQESLSVSGVLLAKVFNRQAYELARYRAENARQVELQVRQAMTGQSFFAVVQSFMGITPALVYLVAGLLIVAGSGVTVTAGTIVAFTTLQTRLLFPTVNLLRVSLDVQTSLALFARIFGYLDLTPRIVDSPTPGYWRPPPWPDGSNWTASGSATPAPPTSAPRPPAAITRRARPLGLRPRVRQFTPWRTSRSPSNPASSPPSWAPAVRAKPRCPTSSPGSTTSTAAGS